MKIGFLKLIAIVSFLATSLFGCDDECLTTQNYILYEPIYQTTATLKDSVEVVGPQDLTSPGKIYFKDGYLFINETGAGIHVIDNRNPAQPQNISFIEIPGNFDLAAKGTFLYADSYVDLVVFDIADINNIVEVNRVESVFANHYWNFGAFDTENQVVMVGYEETEIEESFDCSESISICPNCFWGFSDDAVRFDALGVQAEAGSLNDATAGIGGSMARFTSSGDFMYTLDFSTLRSFDISTLSDPQTTEEIEVGWGMETLFPYENHLFLGAQNGMHIYNIENGGAPTHVSTYEHINSCDPVVVQNDIAYVTLRDGQECGGFTNQLEVVDVSDLSNPRLIATHLMDNPHGLGIDGSCLFICEGEYGLKLFDATDAQTIGDRLLSHYDDIHALDVIPLNNNLMMIGQDGLHQYAYSCGNVSLEFQSTIAFTHE